METIILTIVTVSSTLLAAYLANQHNLKRDREQWERQRQLEIEKLDRDERKQRREQLIDAYNNSIFYLSKALAEPEPYSDDDKERETRDFQEKDATYRYKKDVIFAEALKFLWLVAVNFADSDDPKIQNFKALLTSFSQYQDNGYAAQLRETLVQLASDDSRLKDNQLYSKTQYLLP
jgi:hypothetical protein